MKSSHFIVLSILLFCTAACANKRPSENINTDSAADTSVAAGTNVPDSFPAGKVLTPVFCKRDPSQSYALYIPAIGNKEDLPVIYFFDPHGMGSLPLTKYKALADVYGFILIGSNNSKNGSDWSTTEYTWGTLSDDTQKRLKIDHNRIYTCGFSGGAKVASYLALHHGEVKGVIAGGAGLPDGTPAGNFNFSFTAIAGDGDMNMTDLVAINNDLDKTQTRHRIIFFDGKHEWAPENIMSIAFAGLQLDAMQEKLMPLDDTFITGYVAKSKKRIEDDTKMSNLIKAEQECRLSISLLSGLTDEASWFAQKDSLLKGNPVFQKQWQTQQNLLTREQSIKAVYEQEFQQGDMNYWNKTISDLNAMASAHTPEGAMYQRLLAYLSLAFYSISNRLITSNQNTTAEYFTGLYKMADPTNSEAWYFSAILNARNNDARATEDDLLKAVENGFTDKNRLLQQPEFQNLSSQISFAGIERRMKSGE